MRMEQVYHICTFQLHCPTYPNVTGQVGQSSITYDSVAMKGVTPQLPGYCMKIICLSLYNKENICRVYVDTWITIVMSYFQT